MSTLRNPPPPPPNFIFMLDFPLWDFEYFHSILLYFGQGHMLLSDQNSISTRTHAQLVGAGNAVNYNGSNYLSLRGHFQNVVRPIPSHEETRPVNSDPSRSF